MDISVDNANITSQFNDGSQGEVPEYNELNVKDLFKLIDEAISRGAAQIDVEYDPQLGNPTSLYIDYSTQIADEELGLNISNFNSGLSNKTT